MVTTAFVLSGGGSLGAVQVGMLQALAAHDVRPDLLVGTSAGAVNAAWVAAHGMSPDSLGELADVWTGLRRGDIFPVDPRQMLRGLLGRSPGVASDASLRRLVRAHATIDDLRQARVPTHLVAADLLSGQQVLTSAGDLVDGVLPGAAIPGILPPVQRAARHLVDGSVALHAGVSRPSTWAPRSCTSAHRSAERAAGAAAIGGGVALHSLTLLIAKAGSTRSPACREVPTSRSCRHCARSGGPLTSATPPSSLLAPGEPASSRSLRRHRPPRSGTVPRAAPPPPGEHPRAEDRPGPATAESIDSGSERDVMPHPPR